MRWKLIASLASALVLVSTATAQSTGTPSRTYSDPAGRFSIAVPLTWQIVPATAAEVRRRISSLRLQGKIDLAQQYNTILNDPYQQNQGWVFQSFRWPADLYPITTDVIVTITKVSKRVDPEGHVLKAFASGLRSELVAELAKVGGTVTPLKKRRIPAGLAFSLVAITPLDKSYGKNVRSGSALVMVGRRQTVVMITFRGDARAFTAHAAEFESIASSISLN